MVLLFFFPFPFQCSKNIKSHKQMCDVIVIFFPSDKNIFYKKDDKTIINFLRVLIGKFHTGTLKKVIAYLVMCSAIEICQTLFFLVWLLKWISIFMIHGYFFFDNSFNNRPNSFFWWHFFYWFRLNYKYLYFHDSRSYLFTQLDVLSFSSCS